MESLINDKHQVISTPNDDVNVFVLSKAVHVAPTLRVEELKDDEATLPGSQSEEEGCSMGEGSDVDGAVRNADEDTEFVPPSDELRDQLIKQVEFYFSDVNILHDTFLLKHVRRNKQGYVSLKLVTSFRKVKHLTKDYRVVAFSLKNSDKVEVNEEGNKVRRKNPLPEYDETVSSRTVIAVNLPLENPTIENVAELFSKCGDISLVRILRPGKNIPQDVKKYYTKHPEVGNALCAVVEFEQHEAAAKACEMTSKDDWRRSLRVVLLAEKTKAKVETKSKDGKQERRNQERKSERVNSSGLPNDKSDKTEQRKRNQRKGNRVGELANDGDPVLASSGSENDSDHVGSSKNNSSSNQSWRSSNFLQPQKDDKRLLSPNSSPRSSPGSSPISSPGSRRKPKPGKSPLAVESLSPGASPHASPEVRRRSFDERRGSGASGSGSPWVQRRLKAQQENSPLIGNSPCNSPRPSRHSIDSGVMAVPNFSKGILRQPKGPDGTKGFNLARSTVKCTF